MERLHTINLSAAWCPPKTAAEPWVRRFGRPTGVEPGDTVWLVVEAAGGCRAVLNGEQLPAVAAGEPLRRDVTERLHPRNELSLAGEGPAWRVPDEAESPGRCPLPPAAARVRLEVDHGSSTVTTP